VKKYLKFVKNDALAWCEPGFVWVRPGYLLKLERIEGAHDHEAARQLNPPSAPVRGEEPFERLKVSDRQGLKSATLRGNPVTENSPP
jgi:hypothetical protein